MSGKAEKKSQENDEEIKIIPARVKRVLDKFIANKVIITRQNEYKKIRNEMITNHEMLKTNQKRIINTKIEEDDDGTQVEITSEEYVDLSNQEKKEIEKEQSKLEKEYGSVLEEKDKNGKVRYKIEKVDEEIKRLSEARIRFNVETTERISIIADEMIRQLCLFAMDNALREGKSVILPSHLHREEIKELMLYKLFSCLPSWKYYKESDQSDQDQEEEEPQDTGKREEQDVETDDEEEGSDILEVIDTSEINNSFVTYINKLANSLKKSRECYAEVRVSVGIKKYLSTLLVEWCYRVLCFAYHAVDYKKQKTVDNETFKFMLKVWLFDGDLPIEDSLKTESKSYKPTKKEKEEHPDRSEEDWGYVESYKHELIYDRSVYDYLSDLMEYYTHVKKRVKSEKSGKDVTIRVLNGKENKIEVPIRVFLTEEPPISDEELEKRRQKREQAKEKKEKKKEESERPTKGKTKASAANGPATKGRQTKQTQGGKGRNVKSSPTAKKTQNKVNVKTKNTVAQKQTRQVKKVDKKVETIKPKPKPRPPKPKA